jgi:hypothetical protein
MNYDDREKLEEFSVKFICSGLVRSGNRFALEYRKNGEYVSFIGEPGGVVEIPKEVKKLVVNSKNHKNIFEIIDRISHYIKSKTDTRLFLSEVGHVSLEPCLIPGTLYTTQACIGTGEIQIATELALCGLRTSDVECLLIKDELSGNFLLPLLDSNNQIVPTERFFFSWYKQSMFIDGEGSFRKDDTSLYEWHVRRIYPPLPKDLKQRRDHLDVDIQLALTSYIKHVFPEVGEIVFHGFF